MVRGARADTKENDQGGDGGDSTTLSLLSSNVTLPLFASFLAVVDAHLRYLEPDFFSLHLPSLEQDLVAHLERLRVALSDAAPLWLDKTTAFARSSSSSSKKEDDGGVAAAELVGEVWSTLVKRWNALGAIAMEKFGWDLGMIAGTRAPPRPPSRRDDHDDTGEGDSEGIPFDELEEGEDAPVIVDLEGDSLVGY